MNFQRIDNLIADVENHLTQTSSFNTPIENYLVSYVLVVIYAEYESRLNLILAKRCALTTDFHLKAYAQALSRCGSEVNQPERRNTGKISISDINKVLKMFGDDYSDSFMSSVLNTQAHTSWDSLVNNRHSVAHAQGCNLTLSDLVTAYNHSKNVLDVFANALSLSASDLQDID